MLAWFSGVLYNCQQTRHGLSKGEKMKVVKIAIIAAVITIVGIGGVSQYKAMRTGINIDLPTDQAALAIVGCTSGRCPGRLAQGVDDLPQEFEDLKASVLEDFGDRGDFNYVVMDSIALATLERVTFCEVTFASKHQMSLVIYTDGETRTPLNFPTRSRLLAFIGGFHFIHDRKTMQPCGATSWLPSMRFVAALWGKR